MMGGEELTFLEGGMQYLNCSLDFPDKEFET